MGWEAWLTLALVLCMLAGLVRNIAGPDVILLGGLTVLMTVGSLVPSASLPDAVTLAEGFGNSGLLTIAVLYVVVAGLMRTGAVALVAQPLLGAPGTLRQAQMRLLMPVAVASAFLNNTPIVAMFVPIIADWCRKRGLSPSRLMMPLSYMAICGGLCTLIGTSTNLVVYGMVVDDPELADVAGRMSMFTIAWVGVPVMLVCFGYVLLTSRSLLPDRNPAVSVGDDPRQYTVSMQVDPGGALVGKTLEQAGLRHLPGLFVAEIERGGRLIAAVGPDETLEAGDVLILVGVVESVVDLRKIRGLSPATDQHSKLAAPPLARSLIEAVVSDSCPLVGKSIREGRFRTIYNAAVLAVARNGQRVPGKIGDIVLRAGDTLLLETHANFADRQRNSRDFFLVSSVKGSTPVRHERAWLALGVLVAMVGLVAAGMMSMLNAALIAGGVMVVSRCCAADEARKSIDWQVLIVIGAALGIGRAVEISGAAGAIGEQILGVAAGRPWLVLLAIYLLTNLLTELVTNNAAAVLVYPIAKASAAAMGVSAMPFVVVIMVAASASFATPIGYQTNLMVYGPGGYRFTDYLRFGLPMNVLAMLVTVALAPLVWGF